METHPNPNSERNWLKGFLGAIGQCITFVALAAQEWLPALIDQPTTPPFRHRAAFKNEFQRIARLLVFSLILAAVILGSVSLVLEQIVVLSVVRLAFRALVLSLIMAICFQPFAYLFGVRVAATQNAPKMALSLRQILFTFLYVGVPWIPVFGFLRSIIPALRGSFLVFALIVFWVCCIYVIRNFARAILLITKSSPIRVWLSILVPLVCAIAVILFR